MPTQFKFVVADYRFDPTTGWHTKQPTHNDHARLMPELHVEETAERKYTTNGIALLATGRTCGRVRSFFTGWRSIGPTVWLGDDYHEGRTKGQCVFVGSDRLVSHGSAFRFFYFDGLKLNNRNRGRFLDFARSLANNA